MTVVVGALAAIYGVRGYPDGPGLALAVAAYSAAAYHERDRALSLSIAVAVLGSVVLQFASSANWVEIVVGSVFAVGIPVVAGRIMFNRRRRIARDRDRAAHDAVAAERTRIARELHDIVAHAISVMVVQAGAARAVVATDPQVAAGALVKVEETEPSERPSPDWHSSTNSWRSFEVPAFRGLIGSKERQCLCHQR